MYAPMQCSDAMHVSSTWARCSQRWPNICWLVTTSFPRLTLFHANHLFIWVAYNMNEVYAIISFHLISPHLWMFNMLIWTSYLTYHIMTNITIHSRWIWSSYILYSHLISTGTWHSFLYEYDYHIIYSPTINSNNHHNTIISIWIWLSYIL